MLKGALDCSSSVGNLIGHLSECFFVNVFVFLTYVASMSIEAIIEDVQKFYPLVEAGAREKIMGWRQNYHSILGFVDQVDDTFGPVLLILITKQFIMFVMWSFSIVISWAKKESIYSYVVLIVADIVLMSLLILGSQQMKNKASCHAPKTRENSSSNIDSSSTGFGFGARVEHPPVSRLRRSIRGKLWCKSQSTARDVT